MSATGEAAPRLTRLGRYELITRIGQGGMAEVQLALQRGPAGFEKLVVVKLVHESLATQKAFVDMLLDEARVAALVKHPNVVDIYDLGEANGRYFIAMEYLEGEPLLAVLRAGREGKRLDALSTGRLIADTAEGLDAAHELRSMSGAPLELVHHDISLGNIVVLYNGQVKLVDFGVAKATQSASTKSKVQGKFSYMAPEKLKGAAGDRRSDIFSLGCVMWEALTLKRLFKGNSDAETMNQILEMNIQPPSKVNGDVPAEFDSIVMRTLERDPDKRPRTAKDLAVEIEEILRRKGYGAKNDRVAKYMQETFKSHIDARKKLVQEVVAMGSASAEVVDAAFAPMLAGGSPMVGPGGEFSMAGGSPNGGHAPPGVPAPPIVANVTASVSSADTEMNKPTEIGAPIFDLDDDRGSTMKSRVPLLDRSFWRTFWRDPKNATLFGSAAAVLAMLVIVIAAAAGHGGGASTADRIDAKPIAAPGSDVPVVTPPAGSDQAKPVASAGGSAAIETGSGSASPTGSGSSDEALIDLGSDVHAGSDHAAHPVIEHTPQVTHRPPPVPVEKPNAEVLFKQGLQAYVKGDLATALAALQKAKSANASFAPTWRVLGQIYEKLGNRASAKSSFQRYLQLAPTASDAEGIKARIENL